MVWDGLDRQTVKQVGGRTGQDGQTGCRREGELAYHLLTPPAGTSTPSVETCRPRPRMKAVGCPQGTIIHLRSTWIVLRYRLLALAGVFQSVGKSPVSGSF